MIAMVYAGAALGQTTEPRTRFEIIELGVGACRIGEMSVVAQNAEQVTIVGARTISLRDQHAFMWQGGRVSDLHALLTGGPAASHRPDSSIAMTVGAGVGGHYVMRSGQYRPFLYVNGTMIDFGALATFRSAGDLQRLEVITYQGDFIISGLIPRDPTHRTGNETLDGGAWLDGLPFPRGEFLPLPVLNPGDGPVARDVLTDGTGNHLEFVGFAENADQLNRPVLVDVLTGKILELRMPARMIEGSARAINHVGQIVGFARGPGPNAPMVWDSSGLGMNLADITTPQGEPSRRFGFPSDINIRGIAGGSDRYQAALWIIRDHRLRSVKDMRIIPLQQIIDPREGFRRFEGEVFINDAGYIACVGHRRSVGPDAILIRPVEQIRGAPSAPWGLAIDVLQRPSVGLTWNDTRGELWYEIDRRLNDGPFEFWRAVSANSTSVVIERVSDPGTRTYRIRAVNYDGESLFSHSGRLIVAAEGSWCLD